MQPVTGLNEFGLTYGEVDEETARGDMDLSCVELVPSHGWKPEAHCAILCNLPKYSELAYTQLTNEMERWTN